MGNPNALQPQISVKDRGTYRAAAYAFGLIGVVLPVIAACGPQQPPVITAPEILPSPTGQIVARNTPTGPEAMKTVEAKFAQLKGRLEKDNAGNFYLVDGDTKTPVQARRGLNPDGTTSDITIATLSKEPNNTGNKIGGDYLTISLTPKRIEGTDKTRGLTQAELILLSKGTIGNFFRACNGATFNIGQNIVQIDQDNINSIANALDQSTDNKNLIEQITTLARGDGEQAKLIVQLVGVVLGVQTVSAESLLPTPPPPTIVAPGVQATGVPTAVPAEAAAPTVSLPEKPTPTPQPEIKLKASVLQVFTTADQRSANQTVNDIKNINIIGTIGDYYQVQLADGQSGFILKSQVEIASAASLPTVTSEKLAWMTVPSSAPNEIITAGEFQITTDIVGQGDNSLLDVVFQSSSNIGDWSGRQFLRMQFANNGTVNMGFFDGTQPGPEWSSKSDTRFSRPSGPITARILNDSTYGKKVVIFDQSGKKISELTLRGVNSPQGVRLVQKNITINPDSFALQIPPLTTELPITSIQQNGINLRQQPGTQTQIVGQLNSSDNLLVLGKNTTGDWIRVAVVGKDGKQAQEGWVAANLLTNIQTEKLTQIASPPIIQAPVAVTQPTQPAVETPSENVYSNPPPGGVDVQEAIALVDKYQWHNWGNDFMGKFIGYKDGKLLVATDLGDPNKVTEILVDRPVLFTCLRDPVTSSDGQSTVRKNVFFQEVSPEGAGSAFAQYSTITVNGKTEPGYYFPGMLIRIVIYDFNGTSKIVTITYR